MDHEQTVAVSAASLGLSGLAIHGRNYSSREDFSAAFGCILNAHMLPIAGQPKLSGSTRLFGNRTPFDRQGGVPLYLEVCYLHSTLILILQITPVVASISTNSSPSVLLL